MTEQLDIRNVIAPKRLNDADGALNVAVRSPAVLGSFRANLIDFPKASQAAETGSEKSNSGIRVEVFVSLLYLVNRLPVGLAVVVCLFQCL